MRVHLWSGRNTSARRPVRFRPRVEELEGRTLLTTGTFAVHIHPNLAIALNGERISLPSNIGTPPGGNPQEMHTHDGTGQIHVESQVVRDFNLEEFFDHWDQTIAASLAASNNPFLFPTNVGHEERCRLIGSQMQITVNGQPASSDPLFVLLHDRDNIAINALTLSQSISSANPITAVNQLPAINPQSLLPASNQAPSVPPSTTTPSSTTPSTQSTTPTSDTSPSPTQTSGTDESANDNASALAADFGEQGDSHAQASSSASDSHASATTEDEDDEAHVAG